MADAQKGKNKTNKNKQATTKEAEISLRWLFGDSHWRPERGRGFSVREGKGKCDSSCWNVAGGQGLLGPQAHTVQHECCGERVA